MPALTAFEKFLLWEAASRDTIDFKKIYVDMAGDLNAGLMLSEIVYWYLPTSGTLENKLRVEHDGFYWIACRRYEWWDRTRLSPDKADRALDILLTIQLIEKHVYKFANDPTLHVRLNEPVFMARWSIQLNNPAQNPYTPPAKQEPEPAGESVIGKKAKTKSGKTRKRNEEKPDNEIGKNPKSLTETPALITASGSTVSGPEAAKLVAAVIEVWVKGWPGPVSGRPYSNKTYRADAETALKAYALEAIQAYTKDITSEGKRWHKTRPVWSVWFNDMGVWINQNKPQPKTDGQKAGPTDEQIRRAAEIKARQKAQGSET